MQTHLRPLVAASVALAVALAPRESVAQDSAALAPLSDRTIQELLRHRIESDRKGVGIVAGVVTDSGASVVAYGACCGEGTGAGDGQTIFEIGSITKVFTAILLADMVHRGEVRLDDPISKFLPAQVTTPTRDGRAITLVDLATHTSGLPRMPANHDPADPSNPYADYTVAMLYEFLSTYQLPRPVGSQMEYSNLGYGLLGHVLARRAGTDYESLVRARILQPLGMTHTGIAPVAAWTGHRAKGHDDQLAPAPDWDLPALAGAGALRSTADDMLRFLAANLGFVDTPLLSTLREAQTYQFPLGQGAGMASLAWGAPTDLFGSNVCWHNGGTGGYRSFAAFDPQRRRGVVVLSNAAIGVDDLGFHLLDARAPLAVKRTAIRVEPEVLERYAGVYEISPGAVRVVTRYRDRLFMQRTGQPQRELFATSPTEFFLDESPSHLTFVTDSAGRGVELVVYQADGSSAAARRVERPAPPGHTMVEVDPALFDAYVGRYQFAPGTVMTITRSGDRLVAELSKQAPLEVFPESQTRFFYLQVEAQLTFQRHADGKASRLILHQNGLDQGAARIE